MRKNLSLCWQFYSKIQIWVYINLILKLSYAIICIIIPIIFSKIIDDLLLHKVEGIVFNFTLLTLLYFVSIFISSTNSVIDIKTRTSINIISRQHYIKQFYSLPMNKIKNYNSGRIFSLLNNDIEGINNFFNTMSNSIITIITTLLMGIITFFLNFKLAMLLISIYPISILINKYFKKRVKIASLEFADTRDFYLEFIKRILTNIEDVMIQNGSRKIQNKFNSRNTEYYKEIEKIKMLTMSNGVALKIFNILNYLLLTAIGLYLVYKNSLSFGSLIAFNTYSKMFSSNLDKLISINTQLQPAIISLNRLKEIDNECEIDGEKSIDGSSDINEIKFKNLEFGYGDKMIFNNLSLKLEKGKIYGIRGGNGSGKTTLSRLLLAINQNTSGHLLINDTDISKISNKTLADIVTYSDSRNILYNLNILDNILLFDSNNEFSQIDIERFARKISLDLEFLQHLDCNNTIITGKTKLSSGQIQKMLLLRTFLRDTPVMIFDEAFSYLDKNTRKIFFKYIKDISEDKIIIIISHNISDYEICDEQYLIENKTLIREFTLNERKESRLIN